MDVHKGLLSVVAMMVVLTIVIIALIATLPKNGAENQTLSNHINNQSGPHARPSYTIALFNRSQLNATGMCINSDIGTNGIKTVCKVNQNASGFKLLSVRYDMAQLLVYNTCVKDANNTALSECGVENISTGPLPSLYCISNKSLVFDWTNLINNTAGFIIYNGPCSLPFNTG